MSIQEILCKEFQLKAIQCENVLRLIDEGNTIPFIARYRKEQTGSLDDQVLREIFERLQYLRGLEKRRGEIESALEEQGNLTDELRSKLADKIARKAETVGLHGKDRWANFSKSGRFLCHAISATVRILRSTQRHVVL